MKHFSKWMLWVHWDAGRCEAETVSERMKGHGLNNCYWNLYVSNHFRNVQTININYDESFVLRQTIGVVIAYWCVFERVLSMKCNWFRSISLLFASNYCKCMCISKIFDWRTTIMALSLSFSSLLHFSFTRFEHVISFDMLPVACPIATWEPNCPGEKCTTAKSK